MSVQLLLQPVKNRADSLLSASVHEKCQEQFFPRQKESQEDSFRFARRMDRVHFSEVIQLKSLEVRVKAAFENGSVRDLRLLHLPGLELHFPLQVKGPCGEESLIKIGIWSPDRQIEFRMIRDDLVR